MSGQAGVGGEQLTAEQTMLRDMVRDWARSTLAPYAGEWDRAGTLPASVWRGLRDMGLCGVCVPEESGGGGMGPLALAVVAEQIGAASASVGWLLVQHNLAAWIASRCDDDALTKRLAAGEVVGSWADGEGLEAGHGARGPTGQLRHVALSEDGVLLLSVGPWVYEAQPEALTPVDPLGCRAAGLVDVDMQGVARPIGTLEVQEIRVFAASAIAALSIGVAQSALDAAVQYAIDRKQFGKPISAFQAIQWMIADSATDLEGARLGVHQAILDGDARGALALQAWAGEAAVKICDRAIQIHGGYGFTTEYPVERAWRDAQWLTLGAEATRRAATAG